MRVFVAWLVLATPTHAEDKPKLVTPSTAEKKAQAEYDKAISEAQATFDKAAATAHKKLKEELQNELEAATKSADLDRALALRNRIKKLEEDGPEKPKGSVNTKESLRLHLIQSEWTWGEETLKLQRDGFATSSAWPQFVINWAVIDRRTVVLFVEKGRDNDRFAILKLSEDIKEANVLHFNGNRFSIKKKR